MHRRPIAATIAALTIALTAAACADNGTVTRSTGSCKEAIRTATGDETPEPCKGFTDAEVQDMAAEIANETTDTADAEPPTDENSTPPADNSLTVGDTYTYEDGLAVTIDSIKPVTKFGEYDSRPEQGQAAFRVTVTVHNGTNQPIDLDNVYVQAEGATNGGEALDLYVEAGSKDMTGRLAAGVKTTKTAEYAIDSQYGKTILVTVSRFDVTDWDLTDPEWTGDIR